MNLVEQREILGCSRVQAYSSCPPQLATKGLLGHIIINFTGGQINVQTTLDHVIELQKTSL